MFDSRRLLATALVATAALGLAACGPDNSSDQAKGGDSSPAATTAPTATAPATGKATGAASPAGTGKPAATAKPSGGADDGPEGFCTHAPLPAGQKWIVPVKGSTATALVYKDTKDVCGVNDVGFLPVGPDKTAQFDPAVKGHLSSVLAPPKDVAVADLVKHINECIATPHNEKGFFPCSDGDYKVAIDASGKVTEMWERASS
ncbi:hypothetical protein F7Q99_12535 [Streptomyces kaniharaensis]|uniref:Secreted protein n=1 Tax=Streptomyces kaniharaensis TaxID=212423 RepID=A0A6N7KNI0_9ACTN|nr:hypothetical protein [Streptomyces kaniharaensis]MQS13090.1 hypothetical protein [Streptomyces kaniharaensis]